MIRILTVGFLIALAPAAFAQSWTHYGGDPGGTRYSPLTQIDRENVRDLDVAWEYQTGDLVARADVIERSAFEGTPIIFRDNLVFCTPFNEIIALDPGTGEERWRFDPEISTESWLSNQYVCRGVTPWSDASAGGDEPCAHRLFMGTGDYRLIAVDAETGASCEDFGDGGQVQVDPGMELLWPGEFHITSPPAVIGDVVIIGSAIGDNARVEAPKGTVRAYDARTGAPVWTFDPIPMSAADPRAESYGGADGIRAGHANVWSIISVDEERDLVFLPTSSPSPDFYGGLRPGENDWANAVVAVRGSTGEVVWVFQTVHHDIWDFDVSAQPLLTDLTVEDETIPVVVQNTKMGFVFILNRETGEPVFPVEERPVPQSAELGEWLSPTQPFPTSPPPLHPIDPVTSDDVFGFTFWDRGGCRRLLSNYTNEGIYTPPTLQGTIMYPFTGGGANWGSAAFDPESQIMVVGIGRMYHLIHLIPAADVEEVRGSHISDEVSTQRGAPYGMSRDLAMSPIGVPCAPPPWGTLVGVNLATGEIEWEVTRGTTEDLAPFLPPLRLGDIALGGPIITAGGLVFEAGTLDYRFRARDLATGRQLWSHRMPAGTPATPMTYEWEGRQYVVIASGGYGRVDTRMGDSIIAFALPE
jgi:quinoprotein glucose dehydrogenase